MCRHWKIKVQKGYYSDVAKKIRKLSSQTNLNHISGKHCAERKRIRCPLIAMRAAALSELQVWNKTYSIRQYLQSSTLALTFHWSPFAL